MSPDDPLLDRKSIEEAFRRLKHLRLTSAEEVLALCAEIFPDEDVPARARLVLEDVFGGQ